MQKEAARHNKMAMTATAATFFVVVMTMHMLRYEVYLSFTDKNRHIETECGDKYKWGIVMRTA